MTKNIFYIFLFILSSCITINKVAISLAKFFYVNAYDLSETIGKNKEDLVCIIISPSCSGVDNFFPEVAKDVERFKKDGVKSRVIIQMLNLSSSENYLDSLCSKYNLQHSLDIIDHKVHPAGGLKRKYNNFLTNLCGKCNNKSLGYPFYIYYKEYGFDLNANSLMYQKIKN